MSYLNLKQNVELEVKKDRISRVIYELNGKYYSCLTSHFTGKPLIKIDYEDLATIKATNKQKGKTVHDMQGAASKKVFSDNGDTRFEIPVENKQTD